LAENIAIVVMAVILTSPTARRNRRPTHRRLFTGPKRGRNMASVPSPHDVPHHDDHHRSAPDEGDTRQVDADEAHSPAPDTDQANAHLI
jgi:hypothetical protein